MMLKKLVQIICLLNFIYLGNALAADNVLKVGVVLHPPFAIANKDESLRGIAVDLWKEIASHRGWQYQFIPIKPTELDREVGKLSKYKYDVIIGPISATVKRSDEIDLTRPYYIDSISVVVEESFWRRVIELFDKVYYSVGGLGLMLLFLFLIYSHFIWLFERRHEKSIPRKYFEGIAFVMWAQLSGGHYFGTPPAKSHAPHSWPVRATMLLWIVSAYVILTLIGGAVISLMTASLIHTSELVKSVDSLQNQKVGVIANSKSFEFAKTMGLRPMEYQSINSGYDALNSGEINAFLGDRAPLEYELSSYDNHRMVICDVNFKYDLYSFLTPKNSPLRIDIDETLVHLQRQQVTGLICGRYLDKLKKNCDL